jgi:hypothetical protein
MSVRHQRLAEPERVLFDAARRRIKLCRENAEDLADSVAPSCRSRCQHGKRDIIISGSSSSHSGTSLAFIVSFEATDD